MIKQQYAKAVSDIIAPLMLLLANFIFMIAIRRFWSPVPEKNYSDTALEHQWKYVFRSIIPVVLSCVFTVLFCIQLVDSVKLLINPEYYAVKDILMLMTNPSQASE